MPDYATYPSLRDRAVLITGGASGIGASFVEHFAHQGARVAFMDIDTDGATRLTEQFAGVPHAPQFLHCDITDLDAMANAITQAREHIGPVAVLINNAANDVRHDIDTTTPADFDRNIAVNLRHQYFATQAVLPDMRGLGGGSIICLGSTGWMRRNPGYPMYAMAKAAVRGMVNGLARNLGREHIRINALVPGWVITEKQQRLWLDADGEAEIAREQCLPGHLLAEDLARNLGREHIRINALVPGWVITEKQQRLWLDDVGEAAIKREQCLPGHLLAEDLARAALFLAADDSRMCTGQDVIVDGGWA